MFSYLLFIQARWDASRCCVADCFYKARNVSQCRPSVQGAIEGADGYDAGDAAEDGAAAAAGPASAAN